METIKGQEFNEKVKDTKGIVLIDFFATWCGPCKMLAPILEQVQAETSAKIYKMDVDECFDLASSFGIMSVPTMIVFKDGEEREKVSGLRQKSQILEMINKYE